MSVATNLVGRPASWHDKAGNNGKGETYIGVICAVYAQVDARIAPRIAIVLSSGQIKSAPLDDVWLLEHADGTLTDLGSQFFRDAELARRMKDNPDDGTGKAVGRPTG